MLITPCTIWPGYKDRDGYGITSRRGKWMRAHRAAWFDVHGKIPEGLLVMHECDNPSCINVEHLKLGTVLDNNRDAIAKGRRARFSGRRFDCTGVRGERHPHSKLTDAQREEIFTLYHAHQVPQIEIARRYGISQTGVSKVLRTS
jgi:hypothetical protein